MGGQEDGTLEQTPHSDRQLEWAGLFLFAVGVFGATQRHVTRHLALWGLVPLDWLYLALLAGGAGLLLLYSRSSPFYVHAETAGEGPWRRLWRAVRALLTLALLTAAVTLAALR